MYKSAGHNPPATLYIINCTLLINIDVKKKNFSK